MQSHPSSAEAQKPGHRPSSMSHGRLNGLSVDTSRGRRFRESFRKPLRRLALSFLLLTSLTLPGIPGLSVISSALDIPGFTVSSAAFSGELQAQEVYTELKKPEQIKTFNKVSDSVICQCGCHFILSSCPHVECPWGIPVRRFMENRIREGMDAPAIIEGLENGFGKEYLNDPVVYELRSQGREDLVSNIIEGHGPSIRGTTANWIPVLLISVFVITALLIALRYFRKRDPFGDLSPPEESDSGKDVDLDRFKDIDR